MSKRGVFGESKQQKRLRQEKEAVAEPVVKEPARFCADCEKKLDATKSGFHCLRCDSRWCVRCTAKTEIDGASDDWCPGCVHEHGTPCSQCTRNAVPRDLRGCDLCKELVHTDDDQGAPCTRHCDKCKSRLICIGCVIKLAENEDEGENPDGLWTCSGCTVGPPRKEEKVALCGFCNSEQDSPADLAPCKTCGRRVCADCAKLCAIVHQAATASAMARPLPAVA